MTNRPDGWVIYDDKHVPDMNRLIVFIGEKGKMGMGVVSTYEYIPDPIILCGAGHKSDYWVYNLYAWKYVDLPEDIVNHFGAMTNTLGFSPIMKRYLNNLKP